MVLMLSFLPEFLKKNVCFAVAICVLVHDVEALRDIC